MSRQHTANASSACNVSKTAQSAAQGVSQLQDGMDGWYSGILAGWMIRLQPFTFDPDHMVDTLWLLAAGKADQMVGSKLNYSRYAGLMIQGSLGRCAKVF